MEVTVLGIILARNGKGLTKAMDLETAPCVGVMREEGERKGSVLHAWIAAGAIHRTGNIRVIKDL